MNGALAIQEDPRSGPPAGASEQELIRSIREGKSELFAVLAERFAGRVYSTALRFTRNPADAEDVLQEVLLLAYEKLENFRGEASFGTWVHRIAMNAIYGRFRKARRESDANVEDYLPRFDANGSRPESTPIRPRDPEADCIREEMLAILDEGIQRLPFRYRSVVVARDIEGMSTEETADALGLTVSATKTRLHRARMFLTDHARRTMCDPTAGARPPA